MVHYDLVVQFNQAQMDREGFKRNKKNKCGISEDLEKKLTFFFISTNILMWTVIAPDHGLSKSKM